MQKTAVKGAAEFYERQPASWYVEKPEVIDALLAHEVFAGDVLDPAAGTGNIPEAFVRAGKQRACIISSDIVQRGYHLTMGTRDFLGWTRPIDNVVTNPPYEILDPFILHALSLVTNKAAFLVPLARLEGGRRFEKIYSLGELARIYLFVNRQSIPPGDVEIEAKGGKVAYCWLVFDKSHPRHAPPATVWLRTR